MADDEKEKIDPAEMAKGNPNIDLEKVYEAVKLLRKLREAGLQRSEYSLGSPYARRPLSGKWRKPPE